MGVAKALLALDGKTLVERHVEQLVHHGCSPVIVLLRPEVAARLDAELEGWKPDVHVVSAQTSSPSESLLAGAHALLGLRERAYDHERDSIHAAHDRQRGEGVLVVPVDMMPPASAIVHALRAALVPPLLAVTPSYRGRGGHPVLCRHEVLLRLARPGGSGAGAVPSLRDVLRALGARRARLELEEPSVLDDFDVPADLPGALHVSAG
jgi:CTP:molybdopterin cytidylyltransferase MocA